MKPQKKLSVILLTFVLCLTNFASCIPEVQAATTNKISKQTPETSSGNTSTTDKKTEQNKSNKPNKNKKKSASSISWPKFKDKLAAGTAVLLDLNSGMVLYEKNAHKKEYPASITKIMTVLLALENCSMNEIVTFSHDAIYGIEPGSSSISMNVGEKLTMEQCLYAIMLASANEVSWGVGEHISGSIKEFAKLMNKRAKELGCKNTHFVNANGLHHDDHYTSAYDIALIAREAMKHEEFRKVTSTRTYSIPPTNKRKEWNAFPNHHQMVNGYNWPQYEYEYCIGGKTGYTRRSGNTLVTFAQKNGVELVCVVMRDVSPDTDLNHNEYTDSTKLFEFAFENYKSYNISEEYINVTSDDFPLFTTFNAFFDPQHSPLSIGKNAKILLPNNVSRKKAQENIELYSNVNLKEGENVIGNISYTYGDKTIGSTDILYTKNDLPTLNYVESTKEVIASNVEAVEKYNLKPFIIIGIFLFITFCIWLYWYLMVSRMKSRRDRENHLHF